MQKIIHKLIRLHHGGINIAADLNAAISTGDSGVAHSSASSYSHIVQRSGPTRPDGTDHPKQPDGDKR
jgi:hypothetical protein